MFSYLAAFNNDPSALIDFIEYEVDDYLNEIYYFIYNQSRNVFLVRHNFSP